MENKDIKTPRAYLSWSQMNLFERSPIDYTAVYLYGENNTNPRMELGKIVAEMLEKGEENADKNLEFYRLFLPQYPFKEFDVKANLGDIIIYGKLDGWDPKKNEVGEYKTGSKWTQKMADETGQLSFYALLLYLKYKIKPEELRMRLFWMPTIIDPYEGLKLTGDLKIFETRRTMTDLIDIMGRARRAWQGIISLCRSEGKAIGLN